MRSMKARRVVAVGGSGWVGWTGTDDAKGRAIKKSGPSQRRAAKETRRIKNTRKEEKDGG